MHMSIDTAKQYQAANQMDEDIQLEYWIECLIH